MNKDEIDRSRRKYPRKNEKKEKNMNIKEERIKN